MSEIDDLELSVRVANALKLHDIDTMEKLRALTRKEFLSWKQAGAKSWREITEVLDNIKYMATRERLEREKEQFIQWCLSHRRKLEMIRSGDAKVSFDFDPLDDDEYPTWIDG